MRLKLSTILLLSSVLLNAQTLTPQDQEYANVVASGKSATKLLLETLQKNMQEHMKQGGVMGALSFCSNEAYTLTDKVNSQLPKGISTKRVSMKYRNPANEPQSDEVKVLNSFEKNNNNLPEFEVEKVDEHTYKFYKPLTINKPVCLVCHGDLTSNPALQKAIAQKYPNDKAFGYKMNDLRGAVVVTIKR